MSEPTDEAWREQAARCEQRGALTDALHAYEAALVARPGDVDSLAGLARIAGRLEMPAQALALWVEVLTGRPASLEAVDGRSRALAALDRREEAVETLRAAILAHPHEARLWNSLGLLMAEQGDCAPAITFLDEAVRLAPAFAAALYNRGDVRFDLGEFAGAEADLAAAARHAARPEEIAATAFAQALMALHRGDLGAGWDAYETRLSADYAASPVFDVPGAIWTPDASLAGAHLLVVGEQGVGDEIMFSGVLGDVLDALGPDGRLSLAVEPRLVSLMQRSFPAASVFAHETERRDGRAHRRARIAAGERGVDFWTPLASLPRRFRLGLDAFTSSVALAPDPARIGAWRRWLDGRRPGVGLSWRSGLLGGRRRRQYPDLEAWTPVLGIPGVTLINLQYGATADELAALEALAGRPILTPPAIDLKADLDDLAALCSALDVVISVPNATAALAAACEARTWFVSGPAAWPRLGTDHYPWYRNTLSFPAAGFGAWGPVLQSVAVALTSVAGG